MIAFLLGVTALLVSSAALILPALLNRRDINHDHRASHNIHIARQRLDELTANQQSMDKTDLHEDEIAATLLDDLAIVQDNDTQVAEKPPRFPGIASCVLIIALLPLLSISIYLALGTPLALSPHALNATPRQSIDAETAPIEVLVQQLEEKLKNNPKDVRGWALAARTYMRLARFADAEHAYKTLHQLIGEQPQVLIAWANAEYKNNNDVFSPSIRARLERALQMRPDDENGLWLAAQEAESRVAYQSALDYLRRLLPIVQRSGQDSAEIEKSIARIEELLPHD